MLVAATHVYLQLASCVTCSPYYKLPLVYESLVPAQFQRYSLDSFKPRRGTFEKNLI